MVQVILAQLADGASKKPQQGVSNVHGCDGCESIDVRLAIGVMPWVKQSKWGPSPICSYADPLCCDLEGSRDH